MIQLTEPQARALAILVELCGPADKPPISVTARQLALALWPDSPTWKRRNRNNALGGTMPMKAGTLLWKLKDHGYATPSHQSHDRGWFVTAAGREVIAAGNANALPLGESSHGDAAQEVPR